MTTEELADCLGVAKQTVNRWIREQGWHTEPLPGIKGGRARLISITPAVLEYLANMPALRNVPAENQMQEPVRSYSARESEVVWRQITDVLQNMTPVEQQRLQLLLSREGISGFLTRLGLNRDDEA